MQEGWHHSQEGNRIVIMNIIIAVAINLIIAIYFFFSLLLAIIIIVAAVIIIIIVIVVVTIITIIIITIIITSSSTSSPSLSAELSDCKSKKAERRGKQEGGPCAQAVGQLAPRPTRCPSCRRPGLAAPSSQAPA